MSDRRLLLDGPDLQALVARAEELGGRAVRAERVRKGLLGRAWYEVTVEVPELSAPMSPPATARPRPQPVGGSRPRPAGIGDLLAAAEAAERLDAAAGRAARENSRAARADGAGSAKRERGR